jgi:alpha/beta superfamily hydrolase
MTGPLPPSGRVAIPVGHGQLEGLLREPEAPFAAVVLCHPHPMHGGTMNNNVVYRMGKALGDAGAAVLRFNFRGVGASTGRYDEGIGEEEDARDALAFLAARHPDLPLWMAGFSFGARVALTVGAQDERVAKLFGVGLAMKMFDFGFLRTCPKPKAFIHASDDELAPRADVERLVATMADPKRLWIVEGATHLFPQYLDPLERAAQEAVAYLRSFR